MSPHPAFVLVGGRSSRMGSDKARLRLQGEALAQRLAHRLAEAGFGPVCLVGRDPTLAELGLPLILDADPAAPLHPLWGIAAGLRAAQPAPLAFFAPVDLIGLTAADLAGFSAAAAPCVAVGPDGRRQPLLALLPTAFAAEAHHLAAEGGAAHKLVAGLPALRLSAAALHNAHAPGDLPQAEVEP